MIQNFVSDTEKFTLDGVSSDTLGLYCDFLPPIPMAEQLYTTFNTGADEMGTTSDDVFQDVRYQIRFYTFRPDDFNDIDIKAFCTGKQILMLSHCPDYYFKIRRMSLAVTDSSGYGKRIDYVLTLTLAPFRYCIENDWMELDTALTQNTIYNLHTRYSKPTFDVTATSNFKITCQGVDFMVSGLTEAQQVTVDCSRQIVYSGENLVTASVSGEYPLFNVGTNIISLTGNISSIQVRGNWRDY